MGDSFVGPPPSERPLEDRLDSWKDIAANSSAMSPRSSGGRSGRHACRRHLHDRIGSVYASRTDLDAGDARPEPSPRDGARGVGAHIGALCNLICSRQGELSARRILGVLSLAKKYGTVAGDNACAAALEMNVPEYRFVRRYLERGPQLTLRQVDPLIRELVHYRDLVNQKTQEQESGESRISSS
jgi:hypothetical protein